MGGVTLTLCACAGPNSPFGSLEFWRGDGGGAPNGVQSGSTNSLTFEPRRQMLHQAKDFSVLIPAAEGGAADVHVAYNGHDVTKAFLHNSKSAAAEQNLVRFTYRNLRLNASQRHNIAFYYRVNSNDAYTVSNYLPPVCPLFAKNEIKTTDPFEPKPEYLRMIKS